MVTSSDSLDSRERARVDELCIKQSFTKYFWITCSKKTKQTHQSIIKYNILSWNSITISKKETRDLVNFIWLGKKKIMHRPFYTIKNNKIKNSHDFP